MSQRRVLIVDDSRTAQVRLRKMLEQFDLLVDTVLSAEEAFGYLSYRQPSVIFLDHHMEGMDGLDALKIIKSNPDTALIPVIMYTSEQGDVYVGQARALGAIDIIAKEVIKKENLEKVLSSLGIRTKSSGDKPEAAGTVAKPGQVVAQTDSAKTPTAKPAITEPSALDQVQRQVSRLFELHITKVRQEIEDSSKFVLRRLTKELQEKSKPKVLPATEPTPPVEEPVQVEQRSPLTLLMGLILIVVAFAGYHLYINNKYQAMSHEQLAGLTDRVREQETLITRLFDKVGKETEQRQNAQVYSDQQVLLDALSWAVSVNSQITFGETPLNTERAHMLGELIVLLEAANFSGTIYLDTHLGNYCVVEGPGGNYLLPPAESNISDCIFLDDRVSEVPVSEQVSISFLNFLNSAPALISGSIQVELSTQNYTSPAQGYPPQTSATSAGQWNEVAQKNSRVTVMLSSD